MTLHRRQPASSSSKRCVAHASHPSAGHAQWARVFKALGHPTRLFIFDRVSYSPESVLRLSEMVGADASTLSRHLHILAEAGLIHCRGEGTYRYYSAVAGCVQQMVGCIRATRDSDAGLQGIGEPRFESLAGRH